MELEKVISISGKPGLFRLVSQLKNGFIIEDISTKKKVSIGNNSQVSLLDNIAVYTTDQEVPLFQVFKNMAEHHNYEPTIPHKSSEEEIRGILENALPEYDRDRVYVSDIRKMAQWYNILQKAGYIKAEVLDAALNRVPAPLPQEVEETAAEPKESANTEAAAASDEEKPAPKKKAAPKKKTTEE